MNPKFIITALIGLGPAVMSAQTDMTVNPATDITEQWGTERTERYDVAFRLYDTSLVGTEIKAVKIPFTSNDAISGCSIWLTRELLLEDGENNPDILQINLEPEAGFLSVALPEPVTVTEEGCYVGFSFSINEINEESKVPVTVSPTSQPGEMYVHTSRRFLKWGTQNLSFVPDINITLSGDFHPDAMAVISLPETGSLRNKDTSATVVLRNHGLNPVTSIDYKIDVNDNSITRHIDFAIPVPTHYFADVPLEIEMDSDYDAGSYPITFTVTEVNGTRNEDTVDEIASYFFVYPYLPERLPLMEEFTGTWCGWCPRGIVGMGKMSELFPDKFIYAAYHRDKDPMTTVEETPTPYKGAPSGYLDRVLAVDPYNGTHTETVATAMEGIGESWLERSTVVTTGEITATAMWTDASRNSMEVNSKALFVRDYFSPRFRIGYLLTGDGLKGEGAAWIQSNYFSDEDVYADTELIEFVEKPRHIADMSYDGVVVMSSPLTGVEGSVPETIKMESPVIHSFTFDLQDAVNYQGHPLPIDKDRLKVITFIADTMTGEIVNCTQCEVTDEAAVENVRSEKISLTITDNQIIISGISCYAKAALYSAEGALLDRNEGHEEIQLTKPAISGVYILIINDKSRKILL